MAKKKPDREEVVESYLVNSVISLGGVAEKTINPGVRGYFDRVCVLPGGRVIFVECKRPKGGVLAAHQKLRRDLYLRLGAEAVVIKSTAEVDALLATVAASS